MVGGGAGGCDSLLGLIRFEVRYVNLRFCHLSFYLSGLVIMEATFCCVVGSLAYKYCQYKIDGKQNGELEVQNMNAVINIASTGHLKGKSMVVSVSPHVATEAASYRPPSGEAIVASRKPLPSAYSQNVAWRLAPLQI